MAKISHIFRAPKKRLPMEELDEVRVITNVGLEGCAHGRPSSARQVLLVDRETLEAMDLRPGGDSRKYYDRGNGCAWPGDEAGTAHRGSAIASGRDLPSVRSAGKNPAGVAARNAWAARNAVPGAGGRNDS